MLDRLVSLAGSEVQSIVFLEYFPFKKIQSIPDGTCAFIRPKFNNAVALLTWTNNTPANLALARSAGRDLASIIATGQQESLGQVYGNYGTFFVFCFTRLREYTSS